MAYLLRNYLNVGRTKFNDCCQTVLVGLKSSGIVANSSFKKKEIEQVRALRKMFLITAKLCQFFVHSKAQNLTRFLSFQNKLHVYQVINQGLYASFLKRHSIISRIHMNNIMNDIEIGEIVSFEIGDKKKSLQSCCILFVCLFVCLFKGTQQTPTRDINTELATANLTHTCL